MSDQFCFDGRLCRRACPEGSVCARADQEVESKTVQQMLEDLVCTIHRDGGHRIAEVGLQKACEEAAEIASRLVQWRYGP